MLGYAKGFQVSHIATFGLNTCSQSEEVKLLIHRLPSFDQIPVEENGKIVGVFERGKNITGRVSNQLRKLDDSILVSSEESLCDFLPLLAQSPYYRLVLKGSKISGIVTRSDVLKLPVRLYGFALVTNLELIMIEIIRNRMPNDEEWLSHISNPRQSRVKDKRTNYESKHLDLSLIELTDFCDKRDILKKLLKLPGSFSKDLEKIEDVLRNPIAHAITFVPTIAKLEEFINNLQTAQKWILELNRYLVDQ
jgi:CBS domain-containing protein